MNISVSFHGHIFFFLLGKYVGEEGVDCKIGVCLTFKETVRLFSKVDEPFDIPTRSE